MPDKEDMPVKRNFYAAVFAGPTAKQAAEMKARAEQELLAAKERYANYMPICREVELGFCNAWDCPLHGEKQ